MRESHWISLLARTTCRRLGPASGRLVWLKKPTRLVVSSGPSSTRRRASGWTRPLMGGAYGGLGDIDRAIGSYEKGMKGRAPSMINMKVGVPWDAARRDPRFQALLRQMNFPG